MNSFNYYQPNRKAVLGILFLSMFATSCYIDETRVSDYEMKIAEHEEMFLKTMQDHLDAVSSRNLTALQGTLPPNDTVQFILPGREMTSTADDFMRYHREWFQDTTWTLESEIFATEVGEKVGIAITEILYREPDREGKPYFNRMIVSYGLRKVDGKWYVFKDHASSLETS